MAGNKGLMQIKNRLQIANTEALTRQNVHDSQPIGIGKSPEEVGQLRHLALRIYAGAYGLPFLHPETPVSPPSQTLPGAAALTVRMNVTLRSDS